MAEFPKDQTLTKILRSIAVSGVLLVALAYALLAKPLLPNENYSFYALIGVTIIAFLALLILLPRTLKVLRNPDLLVPAALYVTATGIISLLLKAPSLAEVSEGGYFFSWISLTGTISWILQIAAAVCFVGWTTRVLLGFAQSGNVDLGGSFGEFFWWFPRTFRTLLFGWLPWALLTGLLFLPVWATGNPQVLSKYLTPFVWVIGISSLLWNVMTVLLVPHVLSTRASLLKAIPAGLRLSWSNKRKTVMPVIMFMIVSGWIVSLTVNFTEYKDPETNFGESTTSTSFLSSQNSQTSVNFVWVGDYPDQSKWHSVLMKMGKKETLPSTDFKIMLLMLVLGVVLNLTLIGKVWGKEDPFVDRTGSGGSTGAVIGVFVVLLVLMVPFEYLIPNSKGTANVSTGEAPQELIIPKLYKGGDKFTRTDLFRNEKSKEEREMPYLSVAGAAKPDQDELELNDIEQVYVGEVDDEPGLDILAAGDESAFVLNIDGTVKKEIDYKLGRYFDTLWQERRMVSVGTVDFDQDGKVDIAGWGHNVCGVIDLKGRFLWKYPARKDEDYWPINAITVADADNDGELDVVIGKRDRVELFSKSGRLKWSTKTSGNGSSIEKIEVADFDGDGENDIFTDDSLYDGEGVLKEKIKKPENIYGVLTGDNETASLIYFDQERVGFFQSGRLIVKYDAPLSSYREGEPGKTSGISRWSAAVYNAEAKHVRLGSDGRTYLVVLAGGSHAEVSFKMLYIYDSTGKLVYHETIKAFFNGLINILPNEDGSESLLITADGKLFKYSLN